MSHTFYSPQKYAEELSFLHSELGFALFHPGMVNQMPIAVGDVGFIHEGSFTRFFNTFCQPTDDINNTDTRTPAEFEPVRQVNQRVSFGDSYSAGVFGSKGVTQLNSDSEMG